ncbi:hypothetical protein OHA21_40885 [Actinoplanes sp. NBC_00393]|uniref:type II secretion system F family protein n=1 Tax=Actinoplanes sp. NBC_00393 TaxID=2975953 RepID=UPI002E1C9279
MSWLIVGGLLAGVAVVLWPVSAARNRLLGRRPVGGRARTEVARLRQILGRVASRSPGRAALGSSALVAVPGLVLGGPVAALVAAAYAGLAGRELVRRGARKRVVAGRAAALDGLCSLVADLRAGIPPVVVAAGGPVPTELAGDSRIAGLAAAVWRLAEQTGAPAADLLERIEADARTSDRAAKSAAAQAAGAQATAFLLAALPLGGIALGYAIGADPLHVLLHTPVGAACAVVAVALQCAGLQWAERLTNGTSR